MRTTLQLDDQLFKDVKQEAARKGKTLTAFIEEALRDSLAKREQASKRQPIRLPVGKGKLMPGVDIDNSAALLELMEKGLDVTHRR